MVSTPADSFVLGFEMATPTPAMAVNPPAIIPLSGSSPEPTDEGMESQWWLYMVRCEDRSLYTGITNDVARRMFMHATGRGARYTRLRGVVELAFLAAMPSPREARIAERSLKQWPVAEKRALDSYTRPPHTMSPPHILHTPS